MPGQIVNVEIKGLKEIKEAMLALPPKMDRPLLNRSLVLGARLVRDAARQLAPLLKVPDARRVQGAIRRAIQAGAVRPEQYTATVWVRVRPLTRKQIASFKKKTGKSAGANINDAYYWRFVEFGTSKMSAQPFMRPAFESRKLEAVATVIADLRPRVQAAIEKLGKGYR